MRPSSVHEQEQIFGQRRASATGDWLPVPPPAGAPDYNSLQKAPNASVIKSYTQFTYWHFGIPRILYTKMT